VKKEKKQKKRRQTLKLQKISTEINFNILDSVIERLNTNRNWLCMIAGDTGTGKSYSALKLGEMIDPDFNLEKVAFTMKDTIKQVKEAEKKSVLVMDEAGVQFGSRESMSKQNKLLSKVLQTFRFKQIALIWTLPDMKMIDVNARRLMHTYLETLPVDYVHNHSCVKWFDVFIDRWTGEYKHRYMRVMDKSIGYGIVTAVKFPKPSKKLLTSYEKISKEFKTQIIEEAELMLTENEETHSTPSSSDGRTITKHGVNQSQFSL